MNWSVPTRHSTQFLSIITAVSALAMVISPSGLFDMLILATLLIILAHAILGEQLLLVFLALRPAADILRDVSFGNVFGATLNVNALLAVMLTIWSLYIFWQYRSYLHLSPYRWHLLLLTALMLASTLYSKAPGQTIVETLKFFNLAALFIISFVFVKTKTIRIPQLLTAIAASAIIPIAVALLQLITGAGITTFDVRGRIHGTLAHPNVFAFFLLSLIILLVHSAYIRPSAFWRARSPQLAHVSLISLSLLMLFTYTRITVVGYILIMITFGLLQCKKALTWSVITVALLAVLALPINNLLRSYSNTDLREFPVINRLTTRSDDADSISWRLEVLEGATPLIRTNPLLGWGYATFETLWTNTRGLNHLFDDSAEAHNDYLRLTVELGIVGLFIYLLFLARLLWRVAEPTLFGSDAERKKYLHLFAWVLAFGVMSISDNMIHHTPVMWLTFTYWGAALAERTKPWEKGFLS